MDQLLPSIATPYKADKVFNTSDWFSPSIPSWSAYLVPALAGRPIEALEIGSYEGRSACWTMENLVTHPRARLTCVDPWDGRDPRLGERTRAAEALFDANLKEYGPRVRKAKLLSVQALAAYLVLEEQFDFIFIDGDHEGLTALTDLVMGWALLKVGGYLAYDDYLWTGYGLATWPRHAWHAFMATKPGLEELPCDTRQKIGIKRGYTLPPPPIPIDATYAPCTVTEPGSQPEV